MRTLHANLTTAQQSASRTPFVRVQLTNRNRTTTVTYTTADATNRILKVLQAEGQFNGHLDLANTKVPISGLIQLNDQGQAVSANDFRGFLVNIGWGLKDAASVNRYSEGPPLLVLNQALQSVYGKLVVELQCISLWDYLSKIWVIQSAALGLEYKPGTSNEATVKEILHELLGGSTLGNATDVDDGTVVQFDASPAGYTSYKLAARNRAFDGLDDVLLLPAVPAVGDIVYFGNVSLFDRLSIDLTTPDSTGRITGTWEYWNGTAWGTFTYTDDDGTVIAGPKDGTENFFVGTLKVVAFDQPTNWAAINGNTTDITDGVGPGDAAFPNKSLFYIRFRVTGVTAPGANQPKATRVLAGKYVGVALDTAVAAQGFGVKPEIAPQTEVSISFLVETVLSTYTTMGVVSRKNGFHVLGIDNTQVTPDYTYSLLGAHTIFMARQDKSFVIPNRVEFSKASAPYTGTVKATANDTNSQAQLGVVNRVVVDRSLVDVSGALTQADNYIKRLLRDTNQGAGLAPMNVGQEIWDLVEVVDARSTYTWKGRVSHIIRRYEPGIYNIQLSMGGFNLTGLQLTDAALEALAAIEEAQAGIAREAREAFIGIPATEIELKALQFVAEREARLARRIEEIESERRQSRRPLGIFEV